MKLNITDKGFFKNDPNVILDYAYNRHFIASKNAWSFNLEQDVCPIARFRYFNIYKNMTIQLYLRTLFINDGLKKVVKLFFEIK